MNIVGGYSFTARLGRALPFPKLNSEKPPVLSSLREGGQPGSDATEAQGLLAGGSKLRDLIAQRHKLHGHHAVVLQLSQLTIDVLVMNLSCAGRVPSGHIGN